MFFKPKCLHQSYITASLLIFLFWVLLNVVALAQSCAVLNSSPSITILTGNSTISSDGNTFRLGFFGTNNNDSEWYLGIWYASIPTPTYVWVANRESPVKNRSSATLEITGDGNLVVKESGCNIVWRSNGNFGKAADEVRLLEEGNLVILDKEGEVLWQSFNFPTDTWLPGMNMTSGQLLTCWRSSSDPAPGMYSLRLSPPYYGEIELVYNTSESYWSTGNWTGNAFSNVPEMTVPYIYRFHFTAPFTETASFGYTERSIERGVNPPLTRFHVDSSGQLRQYTWSPQAESWNMFWSQPESPCRVYGRCGNWGVCDSRLMLSPCKCLLGFKPVDSDSGDFSGGCRRESDDDCGDDDVFEEIGAVSYDGANVASHSGSGSRSDCERKCLSNCSCNGLYYNLKTSVCRSLFGSLLNIRNLTLGSTIDDTLYVRVQRGGGIVKKKRHISVEVLISTVCTLVVVLIMLVGGLFVVRKRRIRRREEEESVFPVTNLKVFTYKELHAATKGFSVQLGHGGFGAVFHGELSDATLVAVKRLDRPGGGEKEFRAEVGTIGNIQHVNLVRLRGFCSEDSHRLLVYDYMPNGPLSVYLKRQGPNLDWDVRFRIAVGTARGIAYLHEECRNCIIHCDIKPENILLDEDFSAKVSDFGLAKLLGHDFSRVLATLRGTWGYVAPEWISGVAITTKADVYSYGMTLLELIGGRRNVEGPPSISGGVAGGNNEKWFFPPWASRMITEGNVAAVVDERLGGMCNMEEVERLGLVAVWCIQDEEVMRPSMGMVVKMLEGMVELTVPSAPKLIQALVSGESFHRVTADSGYRLGGRGSNCDDKNVQHSGYSDDSQSSL